MKVFILCLHIFACISLILIVLLQKGKEGGMGATFGGSSQTVFGSSGANTLLHKITTIIAVIFMLTSLSLSIFLSRTPTSSIMDNAPKTQVPAAETQKAQVPAPVKSTGAEKK